LVQGLVVAEIQQTSDIPDLWFWPSRCNGMKELHVDLALSQLITIKLKDI
jgi:hypothetical protein